MGVLLRICLPVTALLLMGCATNVPTAEFSKAPSAETFVHPSDQVDVRVSSAIDDVALLDSDKVRIGEKISKRLMQASSAAGLSSKQYQIDVSITRYAKGNGFARFMLAGLGQIHIDAVVKVFSLPAKNEVSEFKVSKTFAWGGIYGATTDIQDIEDPFAQAVANALQGKGDNDDQAKKSS